MKAKYYLGNLDHNKGVLYQATIYMRRDVIIDTGIYIDIYTVTCIRGSSKSKVSMGSSAVMLGEELIQMVKKKKLVPYELTPAEKVLYEKA